MAKLTLDKVWLNLLDTGVGLSFYSGRDKSLSRSMKGEVRQYANGNQIAISSKGVKGTFSFALMRVTQTQIDTLDSWLGQAVIYRDMRSRGLFGVFFDYSTSDNSNLNYFTVTITLNQVTYVEGA